MHHKFKNSTYIRPSIEKQNTCSKFYYYVLQMCTNDTHTIYIETKPEKKIICIIFTLLLHHQIQCLVHGLCKSNVE